MKFQKEETIELLNYFKTKKSLNWDLLEFSIAWESTQKEIQSQNITDPAKAYELLGEKLNINFFVSRSNFSSMDSSQIPQSNPITQIQHKGRTIWVRVVRFLGPYVLCLGLDRKRDTFLKKEKDFDDTIWISVRTPYLFTGNETESHPGPVKRIFTLLKLESEDVWVIAIYSSMIVLLSLVVPVGIQSLINILSFGTLTQPIIVLALLVTGALGFAGVLKLIQTFVVEILQQRFTARLITELSYRIPLLNYVKTSKEKPEAKINYFLDFAIVQKSATVLLVDGLVVALQTAVGFLVLIYYHPFFIALDVILISILFLLVYRVFGKNAIQTSIQESYAKHKIAAWLEELSSQRYSFKSKSTIDYSSLRTESLGEKYIQSRKEHFKILFRQISILLLLQTLGVGIVLGVGGFLVIQGEMTLGQLVAAEIILSKILDSFSKSGKYLESFYDLTASMDKIGHLFDIPIDEIGNEKIDPNLSNFSLKTGDLKISSSIGQTIQFPDEFRIQEGEKIGLVCSFTEAEEITDVFFGLQEPINGFPIYYNKKLNKSLSKSGLRSKIRLIRNPDLISGTLRDNFLLYNLGIGSEEIEEALEKIGLLEKINKLESGISTQISTNGYPFKKEERFLLLIASSITSTSDFLILHHTLDQIHSKSRSGLMKYLNEEGSRSQAYFITSSSPENLSFCDRIYQLNSDGKILELSPKAE